jgi:hypothetical protein
MSEIGVGWNELLAGVILPVPSITHNQNVISSSEGISVIGNWL